MAEPPDMLSAVFTALQIRTTAVSIARFGTPFAFKFEAFAPAFCLISVEGEFTFETAGCEPVVVRPGDAIMITRSQAGNIRSDGVTEEVSLDAAWRLSGNQPWSPEIRFPRPLLFETPGASPKVVSMCVILDLAEPWRSGLPNTLPAVVHVRAGLDSIAQRIARVVECAVNEAPSPHAGFTAFTEKLAELMFISTIRAYVADNPEQLRGWLKGAADPQLSPPLAAMHMAPGRNWTLKELARMARMSRSSFSSRFATCVGETPIRHLADWRMSLAAEALRSTEQTAKEIAASLGFRSESAFGAAFKSKFGESPVSFRRAVKSPPREGADAHS